MQPITGKELNYVTDAMSNEELLIKQCAAAASVASNENNRNLCLTQMHAHEQNWQKLMNVMQQSQPIAPMQPSNTQQH